MSSHPIKTLTRLVYPYRYSALWRISHPKAFHCFGIGLSKSGTHSLAAMLASNYRSEHELEHWKLIEAFLKYKQEALSKKEFEEVLKTHCLYSWLDLDVSHTHIEYLENLLGLFPKAKFILTIRDCFTWLDSWLNHTLNQQRAEGPWLALAQWRYEKGQPLEYAPEEAVLKEKQLYPLKNYFQEWNQHIEKALRLIPKEQLLIVRMEDLKQSAPLIANFLEIDENTLNIQASHQYQTPKKWNLLEAIPEHFLNEQADRYCATQMKRFYPKAEQLLQDV